MWKHELLEFLDKEMLKSTPQRSDCLASVRSKLTAAETFYFGEMDGLRETFEKEYDQKTYMFAKFPYPLVLYEFENNEEKVARIAVDSVLEALCAYRTKTAYLVEQRGDDSLSLFVFAKKEDEPWFLGPLELVVERNQNGGGDMLVRNISDREFEEVEGLQGLAVLSGWQALAMNKIVMCQNVVTKDVVPPEKLNRKRVRKGGLPLYSYKVLEVVKGRPASKSAGSVPWGYRSPDGVRFHLCRGHFKTFTEEKPLFGKWTGTFWWQSQARGDKAAGTVEKEYRVRLEGNGGAEPPAKTGSDG